MRHTPLRASIRTVRGHSLRIVAGGVVSAIFIAMTLSRVDVTSMARAMPTVALPIVVLTVAIALLEMGVRAERWRTLMHPLADVRYRDSYSLLSIGHLANSVLPARLGDFARVVLTGSFFKVSRTSVLGTIAVERIADAALLALAAVAAVMVGHQSLGSPLILLVLLGTTAALVGVTALLLLRRRVIATTLVGKVALRFAHRFAAGARSMTDRTTAMRVVALTVASFALAVALLLSSAAAVGLPLPVWQAALVMAAVTLSTAIPAGPASVGTYEFVGLGVLTSMGHGAEQSLLAVVILHAVIVVIPAFVGVFSLWVMRRAPRAAVADAYAVDA